MYISLFITNRAEYNYYFVYLPVILLRDVPYCILSHHDLLQSYNDLVWCTVVYVCWRFSIIEIYKQWFVLSSSYIFVICLFNYIKFNNIKICAFLI